MQVKSRGSEHTSGFSVVELQKPPIGLDFRLSARPSAARAGVRGVAGVTKHGDKRTVALIRHHHAPMRKVAVAQNGHP